MKRQKKRVVKETRTAYHTTRQRPNRSAKFQRLVRALRANDPDIIEIVQFGSSVYAPRLARDVDLLVVTRAKKDYDVYLDATNGYPKNVDVVPKEPNERMGEDIALAILTFSKTLFGNGKIREEARKSMSVPTFDRARNYLIMADEQMQRAPEEQKDDFRDARYRLAFDLLFDAVRYAAMTFLVLDEQTRWSELPKKLPTPFNKRFREFISFLHVQFKYQGTFPKDRVDETFEEWRGKVSQFIDDVAARSRS
ncbi:MAG: nucleotidyltransferase domain-containing protein [Chloroflexota bacterium]|nr:nucleotidyltransferase domain-containing protein [Chloroflexota bacterium]